MVNLVDEVNKILIELGEQDAKILEISKTGSQVLINSPNDLDYNVILSGFNKLYYRKNIEINGKVYDFILKDDICMRDLFSMNLDNDDENYMKYSIYNFFQLYKEVIYGSYKVVFDIFSNKEKYFEMMRKHYVATVGKRKRYTKMTKTFSAYYIPLKIFENEFIEITSEMQDTLNKLYDNTTDIYPIVEWIEESLGLRGEINEENI